MELQKIISALEMDETPDNANVARLIPHVKLRQNEERLTSIVLAAMKHVPEFAEILFSSLSQRFGQRSKLDCFVELQLERNNKTNKADNRPDGLIVHRTGRSHWLCLIEAKSGSAKLDIGQVKRYIELIEKHNEQNGSKRNSAPKIDAFLTISNDFAAVPEHHPLAKDLPKKLKKSPDVYHWSWTYVMTQAELLLSQDEFADSTKRAIIAELVEYMESEGSGVKQFTQMNEDWKKFIQDSQKDLLTDKTQAGKELVENAVSAWHQECRDIALLLSREVRAPVSLKLSRAHKRDVMSRLKDDVAKVLKTKSLCCEIEVPKAASPITINANTASRLVTLSITLECNDVRKSPEPTINWFMKQLKIEESWPLYLECIGRRNKRCPERFLCSSLIKSFEDEVGSSLDFNPERLELIWEINMSSSMPGSQKFIEVLESGIKDFYRNIVQNIKSAPPIPPKMHNDD